MSTGTNANHQEGGKKTATSSRTFYQSMVTHLKRLYEFSIRYSHYIFLVSAVMLLISAYLALVFAPTVESPSFSAPNSQRIFYLHVPVAWVALLAFTLVFVASLLFLKYRDSYWDHLAYASAEVGVLFCTAAMMTGAFWAKAEWGAYWSDDPKLTVTFVLWLIYIGYLVFRNSSEENDAELASILSIFGFVTIPMTFLASRVLTSTHPNTVTEEGGLEGEMVFALVFSVFAFTVLFYYILVKRFTLMKLKHRLEDSKRSVGVMLHE